MSAYKYNRAGYTQLSLLDDGIKFSIKGGALGKLGTKKIHVECLLFLQKTTKTWSK